MIPNPFSVEGRAGISDFHFQLTHPNLHVKKRFIITLFLLSCLGILAVLYAVPHRGGECGTQ